jgi:hypothetical protein
MASTPPKAPLPLPIRTQVRPSDASHQAGGGTPSSAMRKKSLSSFSTAVMAHLKDVYTSMTESNQHSDYLSSIQGETPTEALRTISTFEDFEKYMASPASAAMGPPKNRDMTYPISNYFISTSHNTYLSGNQLYGEASTSAYKNVLVRGCRCLEIDVWNGDEDANSSEGEAEDEKKEKRRSRLGRFASKLTDKDSKLHVHNPLHHTDTDKSTAASAAQPFTVTNPNTDAMPAPWRSTTRVEPRVLHGHTLTKEVSFRSVCETIRDNGFVASSLPLIISLEVHASLEQQQIMVEIMRQTWAGMLVDLDAAQEISISHLPSPDDLRNKILIKVKWSLNPDSKTGESTNPHDHIAAEDDEEEEFAPPPISSGEPAKKAKKASKILHALSQMGVYTRAYTFKSFSTPEAALPNHVFSLSESKVIDFCSDDNSLHSTALFTHNRNYLMRIFPSGLRVNSSNVEPTFLWRQGAQMVALNWQKWDKGMMLNEGMFAGEGGWVLKPEGYRGTIAASGTKGDSQGTQSAVKRKNIDLTIELLAGQDLPLPGEHALRSHLHPYVKMQLHVDSRTPAGEAKDTHGHASKDYGSDHSDDADAFKRRSKTAKTADPDFGGEKLHWVKLVGVIEELSFLRYVCAMSPFVKVVAPLSLNSRTVSSDGRFWIYFPPWSSTACIVSESSLLYVIATSRRWPHLQVWHDSKLRRTHSPQGCWRFTLFGC